MHNPVFGQLDPLPAIEHPELLAPATFRAVQQYLPEALVAPIDPAVSDTEAMCARYDVPLGISANVVLITGKRSGEVRKVACQVLARSPPRGVVAPMPVITICFTVVPSCGGGW